MEKIDKESSIYPKFGKHLKASRLRLEKTAKEIANKIGISQSGYAKYESGTFVNFSQEDLRKICQVLEIDYTETVMLLTVEKFGLGEPTENHLEEAKGKLVQGLIIALQELNTERVSSPEMLISRFRAKTTGLVNDNISFDVAGLARWMKELKGENNFWVALTDNDWLHADRGFSEALYKQLENGSKCTIFLPAGREASLGFDLERLDKKYPGAKEKIRVVSLSGSDDSTLMRGQNFIIVNPTSFTQERFALNCIPNTQDFSKNVVHLIKNPREDIQDFAIIVMKIVDQETWEAISSSGGSFGNT